MAALCGDLAASRGPLSIYELSDSQKAHFTATVEYMTGSRVVYIAHNEYTAQRLYEDFGALYGRDALFFPAREIMLYDVEAKEYEIVFRRVGALDRLLSGDFAVAVMSVEAAVQFVPPPSLFRRMTHVFETGMRLDFQNISAGLIDMGYERVSAVEARGTFAVRGGILDVYPVDQEYAVRVELFDDEIDSIRFFDARTQRTVSAAGAVKILPARDILYEKERLPEIIGRMEAAATQRSARTVEEDAERFRTSGHFAGIDRYIAFIYEDGDTPLSYADGCAYVIDEPVRAFQKLESLDAEHAEICLSLIERGKLLPESARFQLDFHDFIRRLPSGRRIALNSIRSAREAELLGPSGQRVISGKSAISYQGNVELLKTDIRDRLKDGWTVLLLTKSRIKAERLAETLRAEKIPVRSVGQMPMGGAPGGGAQSGGAAGGDAAGGGTVSADAAGRGVTGGKPAGVGMAGRNVTGGGTVGGVARVSPGRKRVVVCFSPRRAGHRAHARLCA